MAGMVRAFGVLLSPEGNASRSIAEKATTNAAQMLLIYWTQHLSALSSDPHPDVRKAVAEVLVAWTKLAESHSGLTFPDALAAPLAKLRNDSRARVRHASRA